MEYILSEAATRSNPDLRTILGTNILCCNQTSGGGVSCGCRKYDHMTSGGVVSMVEFGEYVECLEWLEYNGVSRQGKIKESIIVS